MGRRFGAARYLLLLLPLYALYSSFSRTSLFVFALLVAVLLLDAAVRRTSIFTALLGVLLGLCVVLVSMALAFVPHVLLRTIWWRIALWEIVGITLRDFPAIWLFGNGIDRFVPLSFYPQPHNMYLFVLLEYGLIGLLFTFGLLGWLLRTGLRARVRAPKEDLSASRRLRRCGWVP
jgi:O-antigen ligase